jgi:hypothetical protein
MASVLADTFLYVANQHLNSSPFLWQYLQISALETIAVGELANYIIEVYFNGLITPATTINLDANSEPLSPCNSFILKDVDAVLNIIHDQQNGGNFWNGNDAIVLRRKNGDGTPGAVVDSFGRIGQNPGSGGWMGGNVQTTDQSLCRKEAVTNGDINTVDTFDPSSEWIEFPIDTVFTDMTFDCKCSANPNKLLITGYIEGSSNNKVNWISVLLHLGLAILSCCKFLPLKICQLVN